MDRWVQIAHALPGRVRLRISALRNRRKECAAAARAVAALPGVRDVRADPFTGSFLVRYEDGPLEALAVASTLREATAASGILLPGEKPPPERQSGNGTPSAVGRALLQAFKEVNEDLLKRTGGGVDLGVLVTAAFFTFGAAEVVASRKIPAPPWFNLAWWGFQMFRYSEASEGGHPPASDADGSDAPTPQS